VLPNTILAVCQQNTKRAMNVSHQCKVALCFASRLGSECCQDVVRTFHYACMVGDRVKVPDKEIYGLFAAQDFDGIWNV
jgi:hypothetical protein